MFDWCRKLRYKFRRWRLAAPERKFKRDLDEKKKVVEAAMERFMAYELIKTYQRQAEQAREYRRTGGAWRAVEDNRVPSPEIRTRLSSTPGDRPRS